MGVLMDRRYDHSESWARISESVLQGLPKLSEDVKRHLWRGFLVRANLIEHSLNELATKGDQQENPLSVYEADRLTLLLNSYYLHLCGALDNLAWASIYQFDLLDDVDEADPRTWGLAGLLQTRFLKALKRVGRMGFAEVLGKYQGWYSDLRKYRDPGAHRIPLLVPPSIYGEKDMERREQLNEELFRAAEARDWGRHGAILVQIGNLGTHYPLFIRESPTIEMVDLNDRIAQDQDQWIKLSTLVLKEILDALE